MRRAAVFCAVLAPLPTAAAMAQVPEGSAPFVTIDQERLFAESVFGRRVLAEIEQRSRALAAENRRIEAELMAEERALTELRPSLAPEEFRVRAEAFDTKVQRLRAEQDEKERQVTDLREEAQAVFFGRIVPVLGEVVRERGAVAILDQRVVILALESIDVTDAAIARIDAALGDGAEVWPADGALEAPQAPARQTPSATLPPLSRERPGEDAATP